MGVVKLVVILALVVVLPLSALMAGLLNSRNAASTLGSNGTNQSVEDNVLFSRDIVEQLITLQVASLLIQNHAKGEKFGLDLNDLNKNNAQQVLNQIVHSMHSEALEDTRQASSQPNARFLWLVRHDYYLTLTKAFLSTLWQMGMAGAISMISSAIVGVLAITGVLAVFIPLAITIVTGFLIAWFADAHFLWDIHLYLASLDLLEFAWEWPPTRTHYLQLGW